MRFVLADVDETIAEVYSPAHREMIDELSKLLHDGIKLFMVTGGSLKRVKNDITDKIAPYLRKNILISHCSGSEVWGFTEEGELREDSFYSVYEETFTDEMKNTWREVIDQLVTEFKLQTHSAQPKVEFWSTIGRDPLDIMLDDRGPQITMEIVNGTDLTGEQLDKLGIQVPTNQGKYDLRLAVMERAKQLLFQSDIPITPRLGGNFALDFAVEGISKTTSIQKVLNDEKILSTIGFAVDDVGNPDVLEIWGDKFSKVNGGTDRYMSSAVSPKVRSIDFREEDPDELPKDINIVIWDGEHHLHHGLLEYLQSRN